MTWVDRRVHGELVPIGYLVVVTGPQVASRLASRLVSPPQRVRGSYGVGTDVGADEAGALTADNGAAVVDCVDRNHVVSIAQLRAEVPAPDDAELERIIAESDELTLRGDRIWSRASLVAGRVFTAESSQFEISRPEDLVMFTGAQRRLAALSGVALTAGERTLLTVGSVPATLDSKGRFLSVGLPDSVHTDDFGAVVPDRFEVEILDTEQMASGEVEIAAITSAVERWLSEGRGASSRDIVAFAVSLNDRCFRLPTLPLSDLLTAAGLSTRDGEWGRADQDWSTMTEDLTGRVVEELVDQHQLTDDEAGDFRLAVLQWEQWVGGRGTVNANAFVALLSGRVAAAFSEYWEPASVVSIESWMDQRRLVETLALKNGDHPGVNFLRGMIDLRLGDSASAYDFFHAAHQADEDFLPVRRELGLLMLDASRIEEAMDVLPSDVPAFGAVEYLLEKAGEDRARGDRGEPCRCGSGRKYRSCCARQLRLSDPEQDRFIGLRLQNYLSQPPWDTHMNHLADVVSTEWGLMSFPEALANPFVQDVLAIEAGGAASYLATRRELLTDGDIELLSGFTPQSRDAFDVVEIGRDALTLVHPDTGVRLTIEPPTSATPQVGDAILTRTVDRNGVVSALGPAVVIPSSHVSLLRVTLGSRPTAEQLLGWVCRRTEILRPGLDLTSEIDLREDEVSAPFDIADLARRAMES